MQIAALTVALAAAASGEPSWIEIFAVGTQTDAHGVRMEFTEDHLHELVDSYDPAKHEAPVVVGHPRHNLPAYAWVGALKVQDGKLLYQERQADPDFTEMREAGRFKKRSASFYLPDSPGNPTPGKLHLRHVGWLGAVPPAVKGLKDVEFAEGEAGVVEFSDEWKTAWGFRTAASVISKIRDYLIDRDGIEAADRVITTYDIESLRDAGLLPELDKLGSAFSETAPPPAAVTTIPEEDDMTQQQSADLAAREEQLRQQQQELETQRAALDQRQREADAAAQSERRTQQVAYADALVAAGKLLPSQKAGVVELLQIASAAQALNFADEDGGEERERPAEEVLRAFLDSLPAQMDFSEKGGADGEAINTSDPVALASAALQFQESEKAAGREVSTAAAVRHIKHKAS